MSNRTEEKRKRSRRSQASGRDTPATIKPITLEPIRTGWDSIHQQNNSLGHYLQTPRLFQRELSDPRIKSVLSESEYARLDQDVRAIVRDAGLLAGKLQGLKIAYAGKRAEPDSPEDRAALLDAQSEHSELYTKMTIAYQGPVLAVSNLLEEAGRRIVKRDQAVLSSLAP